ncbi:AcrR family transcriptional regulator [Spinactinospora alkalitolerans]|uniref:AcrR family transcriptional regulator n=1 Tax=Spinactinospora alkalitolerans TaxID=687207 RepID=A0A852TYV3_9ACTN|nr:TetR/AcrR family transcriptional regulator [Spinactinospora alkalitolerans]NYE49108.1 AcrR family transcriptional regulator [Spinactinospora alkalitolerans]
MRLSDSPKASGDAQRVRRAERILDAAGELLVSWGYRRVTIDEVARRAGVGKGTVYLHFATKEALFLTVLMRSQLAMAERAVQRMRTDPSSVLLSNMARSAYLEVQRDPMVRAILTGDTETLGSLTRSAYETAGELLELRERTVDGYFDALREHGALRTDTPRDLQRHAFTAIVMGFLLVDPILPPTGHDTGSKADSLAQVVHSAFELSDDPGPLRAAAPEVIELYQRLLDRLREEIGRRKLT